MFRSDRLIDFVRMNDFLTRYSLAKFQGDTSYKLKSNQLKNALVVVYFYKSGNIFPGIEAAVLIFIFFWSALSSELTVSQKSRNFFLARFHFLQFQNIGQKSIFELGKSLKLPKMQFDENFLIYLISRVFLPRLF